MWAGGEATSPNWSIGSAELPVTFTRQNGLGGGAAGVTSFHDNITQSFHARGAFR
jgi:hypothetical protein